MMLQTFWKALFWLPIVEFPNDDLTILELVKLACGNLPVTSSCLLVVSGLMVTFLKTSWIPKLEATLCPAKVVTLLLLFWLKPISWLSCFLDFWERNKILIVSLKHEIPRALWLILKAKMGHKVCKLVNMDSAVILSPCRPVKWKTFTTITCLPTIP